MGGALISPVAVREFLATPVQDSATVKTYPIEWVRQQNARLGARWAKGTPRDHQERAFLLGVLRRRYAFFLGMGAGKTALGLNLIQHWREHEHKAGLVLVPGETNLFEWEDQCRRHAPELSCVAIEQKGSTARLEALHCGAEVAVITYAGLLRLTTGRKGWDERQKRALRDRFGCIFADESDALKRYGSARTRLVLSLGRSIEHVYLASGTPFDKAKGPEDLWSQLLIVDGGYSLGTTLGMYRAAFSEEKHTYWARKWVLRDEMLDVLARRVRHRSVRWSEEETQDLPPCVGGIDGEDWALVRVPLGPEAAKLRAAAVAAIREAIIRQEPVKSAYYRLRALAAGYLASADEEGPVTVEFTENPKLDALVSKLHETTAPVIVICIYHRSNELVCKRLAKEKIKHAALLGTTTNKRKPLEDFKAGRVRVLVASESICYGLNLQDAARHMFFFESPDSTSKRRQMERRLRREGADKRTIYYYDFVATGIDEKILDGVKRGRNVFDALIDGE